MKILKQIGEWLESAAEENTAQTWNDMSLDDEAFNRAHDRNRNISRVGRFLSGKLADNYLENSNND